MNHQQQRSPRGTHRKRRGFLITHRNLCSCDRSRVYGHCSTTTARFLRVAVTTILPHTHALDRGGGGGGGRISVAASDAGANRSPVRDRRGATPLHGPWRYNTRRTQRILCVCECLGRPHLFCLRPDKARLSIPAMPRDKVNSTSVVIFTAGMICTLIFHGLELYRGTAFSFLLYALAKHAC